MSKHTPGPWKAHDDEDNGFTIEAGRSGIIAEGLAEPDARLIAAAPTMLNLLHFITTDFCFMQLGEGTREEILATIAKAEGAS